MAGGVGEQFNLEIDKEEFEKLETGRLTWYSFGQSLELMKLDHLNLAKKNCSDAKVEKILNEISLDIYNLEKHIFQEYSYLHCLKSYIQIADKLIFVHVMNHGSL